MSVVWRGGTTSVGKLWYMYFAMEWVSRSMGVLVWYEYVAWSRSMSTLSECRINLTTLPSSLPPLSLSHCLQVGALIGLFLSPIVLSNPNTDTVCNGTMAPLDHDNATPSHEFTLWEQDITHSLYYLHVIQAAVGTAIIPITFCEYLLLTSLCLCLSLLICSLLHINRMISRC